MSLLKFSSFITQMLVGLADGVMALFYFFTYVPVEILTFLWLFS
jgi:hypothetical protein